MHRTVPAAILAGLVLMGCARQARLESGGDVAISPTPANSSVLPTGSALDVTLDKEIGTKSSRVGDEFSTTVASPVLAQNGETVVPAGAKIYGKVTGLTTSNHVGEAAAIRIDFERLVMNGLSYPFNATVSATNLETHGDSRSETLKKAGIGAAAGAVLGAVLSGGDLQKILVGGALGAAAGTAISLGVSDTEAVLPAGTTLKLQSTQAVSVR
jgi:hypothetical protein